MKTLLLILILTLTGTSNTFFDAGNCVKYNVEILLGSGKNISGYVYMGSYQPKFSFKDISFFEYIKANGPDTLYLYKNIRSLKFPVIPYGNCEFHFSATTQSNEFRISMMAIRDIKMIAYSVCNDCDNPNEKDGFHSSGIYPAVITELTANEIELLQAKPLAVVSFGHNDEFNTDEYWMLSYSSSYGKTDLEKIRNDFLKETNQLLKDNHWDTVQIKYALLKGELRKKGVVLFKTFSAL